MILFDSSVLVAKFDAEDSQHTKGHTAVASASRPFGIPEYVVSEVATVLTNNVSKEIADEFLDIVFSSNDIEILLISEHIMTETAKYFLRNNDHQLSFVDCSLVVLAHNHDVVTFDRDLDRAIKEATK